MVRSWKPVSAAGLEALIGDGSGPRVRPHGRRVSTTLAINADEARHFNFGRPRGGHLSHGPYRQEWRGREATVRLELTTGLNIQALGYIRIDDGPTPKRTGSTGGATRKPRCRIGVARRSAFRGRVSLRQCRAAPPPPAALLTCAGSYQRGRVGDISPAAAPFLPPRRASARTRYARESPVARAIPVVDPSAMTDNQVR